MSVKYLLLNINLLFFASFAFADATSEVSDIRNDLINWAVTYRKVGDEPRKTVAEYLALLNSDGSFSDKSSTIDVMTGRLVFMAQAFKDDPSWKENIHLKTNLYTAVQYWLNHDPGNSGWTAGCFNEPSSMDSIGLCLYNAIQQDKIDHPEMTSQLDTLVSGMVDWANAAWTVASEGETFAGANIAYRLMGMIGRAALANSPEMFNEISELMGLSYFLIDFLKPPTLTEEVMQELEKTSKYEIASHVISSLSAVLNPTSMISKGLSYALKFMEFVQKRQSETYQAFLDNWQMNVENAFNPYSLNELIGESSIPQIKDILHKENLVIIFTDIFENIQSIFLPSLVKTLLAEEEEVVAEEETTAEGEKEPEVIKEKKKEES